MPKKFQRRIEDFTCENCGAKVRGGGYTNHCPVCLWSKDVDVNPGDRASKCGGLMRPVAIETKGEDFIVLHRCVECGKERRNRTAPNDDFDAMLEIMKRSTK